jgi:hypothetical protein
LRTRFDIRGRGFGDDTTRRRGDGYVVVRGLGIRGEGKRSERNRKHEEPAQHRLSRYAQEQIVEWVPLDRSRLP